MATTEASEGRKKVNDIVGLRLLPPLGIARFGSSPEPLDNYSLEPPDPRDPSGFRAICPARTLIIDPGDGSITDVRTPKVVAFRDGQRRIKPVCPFFEVWARFEADGEFRPLTLQDLDDRGLTAGALTWRATAANNKASRRTGDPNDRVEACSGDFSDHEPHELIGLCKNFKAGKAISLGHVRYIRPTRNNVADDAITSMIRARFTPGAGRVFGPRAGDPRTHDDVYAGATSDYRPGGGVSAAGRWDRYYYTDTNAMPMTAPADIFQGELIGLGDEDAWIKLGHGYFDDACDGIIEVGLKGRDDLRAYARFASAVPDFAPDSLPVRSIADDLEQLVFGPVVRFDDPKDPEFQKALIDVLRRALETVRLMNTVVANGTQGVGGEARNRQNMSARLEGIGLRFEEVFPTDVRFDPNSKKQMYSYIRALKMHCQLLQTALDGGRVTAYYVMRSPEDAGELWPTYYRMYMPAFMRGSEGLELCLTRRQLSLLALAAGEKPDALLVRAGEPVMRTVDKPPAWLAPHHLRRIMRQ